MFARRPRHVCALATAGALCFAGQFSGHAAAAPAVKTGLTGADKMKQQVGYASVDKYVRSGMRVGLGTGSTAFFAVERLGSKLQSGQLKDVVCVPTSEKTRAQAEEWGIPLTTLDAVQRPVPLPSVPGRRVVLDVTIDGADEIDVAPGTTTGAAADQCVLGGFHAVKGGGGALLREKMVEGASAVFVCIVDSSKCVDTNTCKGSSSEVENVDPKAGLGAGFPIPIEVTPFCYLHTVRQIEANPILKAAGVQSRGKFSCVLRRQAAAAGAKEGVEPPLYVTDNGNYIVDVRCSRPLTRSEVRRLARQLTDTVGVVEHGLFIDMVNVVLVGREDGSVQVVEPAHRPRLGDRHK